MFYEPNFEAADWLMRVATPKIFEFIFADTSTANKIRSLPESKNFNDMAYSYEQIQNLLVLPNENSMEMMSTHVERKSLTLPDKELFIWGAAYVTERVLSIFYNRSRLSNVFASLGCIDSQSMRRPIATMINKHATASVFDVFLFRRVEARQNKKGIDFEAAWYEAYDRVCSDHNLDKLADTIAKDAEVILDDKHQSV